MIISACSAPGRHDANSGAYSIAEPILNLRLVASYGPALGKNISFREPSGVAVNRLGEIFVSDRTANAVYRFSPDYKLISDEGGIGASIGAFNRPFGLTCDQALNLFVADSGNRRIQILDRNLRFVGTIDSYFDENNESVKFSQPVDVEIDREGNFWIADNDRVLKLDPFYRLFQEMSYDTPGDFRIGQVSSVDISKTDLLAIGDPGNRQVIIANINGNHIADFPAGSPSGVAWDGLGLLWVADAVAGNVAAYDIDGGQHFRYAESASAFKPSWIAFDMSGRMIVLDSARRIVYLYEIIRGT